MRRHPRSPSRLGVVALLAGLILISGCTTGQSTPKSYNAGVKTDFVAGCRSARQDAGASEAEARDLCTRIYDEISSEVPYEQFKDDNGDLQDDPAALPDRYTEILKRCEDVVSQPEDTRPESGCGT